MRFHSKKRAAQERRLRKIEARLIAEGQTKCFFFPYKNAICFDHIIPKAHNESLIDCEKNLIPICNESHRIIDQGTNDEIRELPNITRYLEKMSQLDYKYFARFLTNHELWDLVENLKSKEDER